MYKEKKTNLTIYYIGLYIYIVEMKKKRKLKGKKKIKSKVIKGKIFFSANTKVKWKEKKSKRQILVKACTYSYFYIKFSI